MLDCWIPQWMRALPYYQLWAVQAPSTEGKTLIEGHTCWDFIMDMMSYLHASKHVGSKWDAERIATLRKSRCVCGCAYVHV
jgi:hypothetical protein